MVDRKMKTKISWTGPELVLSFAGLMGLLPRLKTLIFVLAATKWKNKDTPAF